MADQGPSLQIDNDWKKQAQEEKRKLAEQEKQRAASAGAAPGGIVGGPVGAPPPETRAASGSRGAAAGSTQTGREMPPASFQTLVQSIVTQVLFYLGEMAVRGGEPVVNLDMAKHHIDTLGVLEEKTKNNLSPDEQKMLDSALYEARMRYVSVASQYIS